MLRRMRGLGRDWAVLSSAGWAGPWYPVRWPRCALGAGFLARLPAVPLGRASFALGSCLTVGARHKLWLCFGPHRSVLAARGSLVHKHLGPC